LEFFLFNLSLFGIMGSGVILNTVRLVVLGIKN